MASEKLRQRRRKTALLSAGALSVAGLLLAYRHYQASSKGEGEPELSYLQRFKLTLKRYSDAFLLGGDLLSGILRDLHTFVQSDSSELPQSIRQLAKLLQSPELAQSTSALTAAVFRGITDPQQRHPERTEQASDRLQQGAAAAAGQAGSQASGLASSVPSNLVSAVAGSSAHQAEASGRLQDTVAEAVNRPDAAERLLAALTSDRGRDLVSLVVTIAVRSSTREVCRCYERVSQRQADASSHSSLSNGNDPMEKVLSFAASARGEKLATACISAMATQAMTVYMEKIEGIDTWNDLLRTMCKQQHREFIEQMVRASIREGVYAAFGRQPPHLAQRAVSSINAAPADDAAGSLAFSPSTPDHAAAQERAQLRPSSSSSDAGPEAVHEGSGGIDGAASSSKGASHGAAGYLAGQFLQVASKPDGRSVLLMLTGTAAYEGAHGAIHTLDELCQGGMTHLRAALGLALTVLLCCCLHRANPLICG